MKVLLQIQNLRKSYGDRVLFEKATAAFGDKQKIGVIGRNGAGKSTLFRIILDQEEADEGEIVRAQDLRPGWIEQKNPYEPEELVLDFLKRYTEREEWDCARMAARFNIGNDRLAVPVGSLPGGYQMRVKLTAMLLREPNFLMLDEPTNYLDLGTLLLLEDFLRSWNGGFLLISHDREFLKSVCDQTLEVDDGDIFLYPGGLEEYFEFKAEQREQKLAMNRNIELRRKELQDFVDRFRAKATKARQAQSKMKQLEKLETIEIGKPAGTVRINIPTVETRKGWALRLENLAVGYGPSEESDGRTVASGIDLEVGRGSKVAVLGDNGQGKTTLLKTIAGVLPALSGECLRAKAVELAYYEQNVYAALDPSVDILTTLERLAAPGTSRQQILDMAGGFLFSGDEVKKSVSLLSGGERARVCLAGLLLARRSLLLLDEPTNHLDFETVEALGAALREYSGTVLFVSHDRTFVHLVATQVVEVKNGTVLSYPGTYDEYVFHLRQALADETREAGGKTTGAKNTTPASADESPGEAPNLYQQKKQWRSELNKIKKAAGVLEKQVQQLEAERDTLLAWFTDNPGEYSPEKQDRLTQVETELATSEEEWLEVQGRVEELEGLIAGG